MSGGGRLQACGEWHGDGARAVVIRRGQAPSSRPESRFLVFSSRQIPLANAPGLLPDSSSHHGLPVELYPQIPRLRLADKRAVGRPASKLGGGPETCTAKGGKLLCCAPPSNQRPPRRRPWGPGPANCPTSPLENCLIVHLQSLGNLPVVRSSSCPASVPCISARAFPLPTTLSFITFFFLRHFLFIFFSWYELSAGTAIRVSIRLGVATRHRLLDT